VYYKPRILRATVYFHISCVLRTACS